MKRYIAASAAIACVIVVGCATQGRFARQTQLERDTTACEAGVIVPRNVRPEQRSHYIHDVAAPACLRAMGYDVTPEPWP